MVIFPRKPRISSLKCPSSSLQTITSHFEMFKIFNSTVSQISQLHHPSENPDKSSNLGFVSNEFEELHSSPSITQRPKLEPQQQSTSSLIEKLALQITNPWPEWVHLMEVLLKKGYFVEIGSPFGNDEMGSKDSNLVRTACLNFGRDRFDLIRYLSRRDIQIVVGFGCPSVDRKVVNSGKRLRALVGIDEGNVCSSCSLRGNCDRAYVKAREDEGGRTVDVMRILLTFGLDPITRSVENKPCQNETVKNSVRMLLNEMVEFSQKEPVSFTSNDRDSSVRDCSKARWKDQIEVPTKQGDWICPRCNFLNFAKNVKCLRCDGFFKDRLGKMSEDHDHLPLKKGDWICVKCHFLNFAKNSRCLQCQEKPPKRELNLGEWECDSCHYINFRRNTICLRCDYKRPKSSNSSNPSAKLNTKKVTILL
ncbi:hypothetical protein Nepgr_016995 [Nepenthes gracilis]|uniref:RanBP2-type domain-containing protein n=1 Tax=Nepenthes gracilis TaxID=150966 RepID=A0AAD3SQR3_NEPGR|nr:hypothetical protein Nepgr_016995 [Nepenthes gracilis]